MTDTELDLALISFHDVGLVGIVHTGSVVTFTLQDVLIGGMPKAAEVTVDGVSTVLRNGLSAPDIRMETKDGEVLTLREEDGQILLAIQWDDFVARTHEVVAYTLNGPKITLRITSVA